MAVSVVSLAAVAWWISKQDAPQFPDSASGWRWLVAAVCAYAVALAVRGFRWHRILRLTGIPHKRADAYRLTLVGYMGNNVLPVRGGELLRVGLLGSRTTARRREILSLGDRRAPARRRRARRDVRGAHVGRRGGRAGRARRPRRSPRWRSWRRAVALASYLALRRRGYFHALHEKVRPVRARAAAVRARRGRAAGRR